MGALFLLIISSACFIGYRAWQRKDRQLLIAAILIVIGCFAVASNFAFQQKKMIEDKVDQFRKEVSEEIAAGSQEIDKKAAQLAQHVKSRGFHKAGSLEIQADELFTGKEVVHEREMKERQDEKTNNLVKYVELLRNSSYEEITSDHFANDIRDTGSLCWPIISKKIQSLRDDLVVKKRLAEKYKKRLENSIDLGGITTEKNNSFREYVAAAEAYNLPEDEIELAKMIWDSNDPEIVRCRMHEYATPAFTKYDIRWYVNGDYNVKSASAIANGLTAENELEGWYKLSQAVELPEEVDFTIPLILNEEGRKIEKHYEIYRDRLRGVDPQSRPEFKEYRAGIIKILDETDEKLKAVDPDNDGFKYNVYRYRQELVENFKNNTWREFFFTYLRQ